MIEFLFLSAGLAGTAAAVSYVALPGRGVHRYVVPRAKLRADVRRLEHEADDLVCALLRATTQNNALRKDHEAVSEALKDSRLHNADLHKQLAAFDRLCAENTELRAALDNARAVRPLTAAVDAPTVPHGIPVLPLAAAPIALKPGEPE
ncbi:hypothetical protein ABZX56_11010 [Streptomyces parvulus]|uniref:hypothetical protein n=1 Tax=Streptomyces parvulus TaxID=146923 RepID=UPI0033B98CDD